MADEEKTEQEVKKKKSPLKLIIILVLGLLILGGGGFFAYKKFLAPKPKATKAQIASQDGEGADTEGIASQDGEEADTEGADTEGVEEKMPKVGPIFDLEPFIVNLEDQKDTRYLKAKLSLELKGQKATEELNKRLPQIRDIMIEVLSSKTYSELATLHGKEHLKNEIMIRLNSILKTGTVRNVFFTEFVMQ